ncbi:MAG: hypothetical protein FJ161_01735 [Gammaproteobacteria bacterium]|nr:hypothetical protein [Gammaproteobacteria bacterium]
MRFRVILGIIAVCMLIEMRYFYHNPVWHDSFFQELNHSAARSCRMIQIWVSPGAQNPDQARLIGGDDLKFQKWKKSLEAFCQSATPWVKKYPNSFQIELIVDENVLKKHQELQEDWHEKYGDMIKWTVWNTQLDDRQEQWSSARIHCEQGSGSICSDWLRILALFDQNFDINIYIDIDTFSEVYGHQKIFDSAKALGVYHIESGLYNTYFSSPFGASWNNNLLIDRDTKPQVIRALHEISQSELQKYHILYKHIATRKTRLQKTSMQYDAEIEDMVDWAIQHPSYNINEYAQILGGMQGGIGPGLWEEMLERGFSQPYYFGAHDDLIGNYGSWQSSIDLPCYFATYHNYASMHGPEIAKEFIRLSFYLFDLYAIKDSALKTHLIGQVCETFEKIDTYLTYELFYGDEQLMACAQDWVPNEYELS